MKPTTIILIAVASFLLGMFVMRLALPYYLKEEYKNAEANGYNDGFMTAVENNRVERLKQTSTNTGDDCDYPHMCQYDSNGNHKRIR